MPVTAYAEYVLPVTGENVKTELYIRSMESWLNIKW